MKLIKDHRIVGTWRRKKPEFWNAKKAYPPKKIHQNRITNYVPGEDLKIPVHNRFGHTNFDEIKIDWKNCLIYREIDFRWVEPKYVGKPLNLHNGNKKDIWGKEDVHGRKS